MHLEMRIDYVNTGADIMPNNQVSNRQDWQDYSEDETGLET